MKKSILAFILIIFVAMAYKVYSNNPQPEVVKRDLVPDDSTAIKIAEAIWLPIYGDMIYTEKPYVATLIDSSVWVVKGTLNSSRGGTAYIEIQKKDCKVLKVTHSR